MKPVILLLVSLCLNIGLKAQVSKTIALTAGNLYSAMTAAERSSVTNLTLTGTMDARDFKTTRDQIPLLSALDLSGVMIVQYEGSEGTSFIDDSHFYFYAANEIPRDALFFCSGLRSIILPSSVNSIGANAFYGCSGLTSITIQASHPPVLGTYVFENVNFNNCTLTVPYAAKVIYSAASIWNSFTHIEEVDHGFTVSAHHFRMGAAGGIDTQIHITANVDWRVISDQSWLTVSPQSGTGNQVLTLTVGPNWSHTYRAATLSFLSSVSPMQTMTVQQGGSSQLVNVTAGGLHAALLASGGHNISNLFLTGTIDARDFRCMRDDMPYLEELDLSGVSIAEYNGEEGTIRLAKGYPEYHEYSADEIADYAFYGLGQDDYYVSKTGLISVILPPSITSIGDHAFTGCSGLTGSFTIPSQVTFIGASGFERCSGITAFYANATMPADLTSSPGVFSSIDKITCKLYVPNGSLAQYAIANQWKDFSHIQEMVPSSQHFITSWLGNGFDHMNFYTRSAKMNEMDLQPGDEIGIFDGSICVGAGVLTQMLNGSSFLDIKVSKDDPTTPETDGYTTGHHAIFKIWDARAQNEIAVVNITYDEGNNIFESGASCWYHIAGFTAVDQEIQLMNGWNIFSLYVTPENTDMARIIQPLTDAHTLIKVQNEKGDAIEYIPGTTILFNNIGAWTNTEGYKIMLNSATTFTLSGLPIYQPVPINLTLGWNIISYPVPASRNAMAILHDIIESNSLVKVQNENGSAIERIPGGPDWINNIVTFDPGEGYKVRVSANDVLTINPFSGISAMLPSPIVASASYSHFKTIWQGNGLDHMNVYLTESNVDKSILKAGNEIGIFDGINCVGTGMILNSEAQFHPFVASADDPTTPETDGFIQGHALSIKVWDSVNQKELPVPAIKYYPESSQVYEPMGSAAIEISSIVSGLDASSVGDFSLGNNYPNPFIGQTTIPYVIAKETFVDISIYDLLGKRITPLVHAYLQPGRYTTQWQASGETTPAIQPGIYICKMQSSSMIVAKLIVVE